MNVILKSLGLGVVGLFMGQQVVAQTDQDSLVVPDKPQIHFGGALRFNYNLSNWKEGQMQRGGDFGYDMFRVNAKVDYKGLVLNAEYRFYSSSFGGGMLKEGWVGYNFNVEDNIKIGLTQVPFGITEYDSHNWFFGLNYYLGLEDDHDMGIKFTHENQQFKYVVAFFKNGEDLQLGSYTDASNTRYSYDAGSIDLNGDGELEYRNKEVNQVNAKFIYKQHSGNVFQRFGASAEFGGLYNLDTKKMGTHFAVALHYELDVEQFNLKAQVTTYTYNPKAPANETANQLTLTAYGSPYLVASTANTYTLGLAYVIPIELEPFDSIMFYNDFGYMQKFSEGFDDSIMNVTGAMVTAGPIYTYIDFALGKNHAWLGQEWTHAFASGADTDPWGWRFNINIGYYF